MKWQWWNEPGGMMPMLSTNGTIVPEPVNCYSGSAERSHWSARLYLLDETEAHYADIWDHIWQIYDFTTKKTQLNALNFECLFWTNRMLHAAVTLEVFRNICVYEKGYIAVKTVWKSLCCVSGWIYAKLWKLHIWCLSHAVKNITTSQEVLFI